MFDVVYRTTGLRWMHSSDIEDMRSAIIDDDDDDGPDGGSPVVHGTRPERSDTEGLRRTIRR
ncbi:hypothetical protein FGK63_14820 [Ruegeria sediminis]|uniref:Uncharacterized protein n=1 Tax=Ruegeria sediminis TaxID=2583820 RepID=A0ABY2WUY7_9RHOB|nr:hypothetical protein [Ruegeria sediminis]TMV06417.1 hypothetical protein FGK63_14820 [Ruegeria sediminis]